LAVVQRARAGPENVSPQKRARLAPRRLCA